MQASPSDVASKMREPKSQQHSVNVLDTTDDERRGIVLEAVDKLPLEDSDKVAFYEAQEKVPWLVRSESDPLVFLNFHEGNVENAAAGLVELWTTRKRLFGERTYLPLFLLSGEGALTDEDIDTIKSEILTFLPDDSQGRKVVLFVHNLSMRPDLLHSLHNKSSLRVAFYLNLRLALEQRRSVLIRYSNTPRTVQKAFRTAHPFRHEDHFLLFDPPPGSKRLFKETVLPAVKQGMVKGQNEPVVCFGNSPEQFLRKLMKYGFEKDKLPPCLGGTWSFDNWSTQIESEIQEARKSSGLKPRASLKAPPKHARTQTAGTEAVSLKRADAVLLSSHKVKYVTMQHDLTLAKPVDYENVQAESLDDMAGSARLPGPETLDAAKDDVEEAGSVVSSSSMNKSPLKILAAAAQKSRVKERKERKRKLDAIYARERRKRERTDEAGLHQQCHELIEQNVVLMEERKRLTGLLREAILVAASLDAQAHVKQQPKIESSSVDVPSTFNKGHLSTHDANGQVRSSAQTDLLPLLVRLQERHLLSPGEEKGSQTSQRTSDLPVQRKEPSPCGSTETVRQAMASLFKTAKRIKPRPVEAVALKKPPPNKALAKGALTEGLSVDPCATVTILTRLNQARSEDVSSTLLAATAFPEAFEQRKGSSLSVIRDVNLDRQRVLLAIQQIPLSDKTAFCEAVQTVPALIETESDPACFLRLSKGNDEAAARSLVDYWTKRRAFFGFRCFLPMHATGKGTLNDDDVILLRSGFLSLLPEVSTGRAVLCLDDTNISTDEQTDRLRRARCVFYLSSIAIQVNKPIVFIRLSDVFDACPYEVKDIIPYQLDSVHHLYVASPVSANVDDSNTVTASLLQRSITNRDPAPVVFTGKAPQDFLKELQKHGFSSESLPRCLGGQWGYQDFMAWIDQRRAAEASGGASVPSSKREESLPSSISIHTPFPSHGNVATAGVHPTFTSFSCHDPRMATLDSTKEAIMLPLLPHFETTPTSQQILSASLPLSQMIQVQDAFAQPSGSISTLLSRKLQPPGATQLADLLRFLHQWRQEVEMNRLRSFAPQPQLMDLLCLFRHQLDMDATSTLRSTRAEEPQPSDLLPLLRQRQLGDELNSLQSLATETSPQPQLSDLLPLLLLRRQEQETNTSRSVQPERAQDPQQQDALSWLSHRRHKEDGNTPSFTTNATQQSQLSDLLSLQSSASEAHQEPQLSDLLFVLFQRQKTEETNTPWSPPNGAHQDSHLRDALPLVIQQRLEHERSVRVPHISASEGILRSPSSALDAYIPSLCQQGQEPESQGMGWQSSQNMNHQLLAILSQSRARLPGQDESMEESVLAFLRQQR